MRLVSARNSRGGATKARAGEPVIEGSFITIEIEIGRQGTQCATTTAYIYEKWILDQLAALRSKRIELANAAKIKEQENINALIKAAQTLKAENQALKEELAQLKQTAKDLVYQG